MTAILLDLFSGLAAFVMLLGVSVLTREHQDIRTFALTTFITYFASAYVRGKASNRRRWFTSLRIGLGGIVPVVTMKALKIAFTSPPFFVSFLLLSTFAIALAMCLRLLSTRSKKGWAVTLGLVSACVVLFITFSTIPRWMEDTSYQAVDRPVAPFAIETLSGEKIASETWKGRVVVLSFWATWCTPCQAELPQIATLRARYRGNPNVVVIALNSGNHGETANKAQAYVARRQLALDSAMDSSGISPGEDTWGPAARSLGVQSLPVLYVLDRAGRLKLIHIGYDPSEHLADSLSRHIDLLLSGA